MSLARSRARLLWASPRPRQMMTICSRLDTSRPAGRAGHADCLDGAKRNIRQDFVVARSLASHLGSENETVCTQFAPMQTRPIGIVRFRRHQMNTLTAGPFLSLFIREPRDWCQMTTSRDDQRGRWLGSPPCAGRPTVHEMRRQTCERADKF